MLIIPILINSYIFICMDYCSPTRRIRRKSKIPLNIKMIYYNRWKKFAVKVSSTYISSDPINQYSFKNLWFWTRFINKRTLCCGHRTMDRISNDSFHACFRYCGGVTVINFYGTFVFVRWRDKSTNVQLRISTLMAHRINKLVGDSATSSYEKRKSGTCEINTSTWITGSRFSCIYFIMSEARKYSGKSGCRESTHVQL